MPHGPATFSCPQCQTPLRIREHAGDIRQFDCPECRRPLELLNDDENGLIVRLATRTAPTSARLQRKILLPASGRWARLRSTLSRRMADPLTVTWLAAGIVAASLIIAVARERGTEERIAPAAPPTTEQHRLPADETATAPVPGVKDTIENQSVASLPPVAGEPGNQPSGHLAVAASAVKSRRPPVVAVKPAEPSDRDLQREIESHLGQRIVAFEQPTPVAFDTLRVQIEEIAGVAIGYDDALGSDPPHRRAEVSVSLANPTLADVLTEITRQAGLDYRIERDRIRLVLRSRSTPSDSGDSE